MKLRLEELKKITPKLFKTDIVTKQKEDIGEAEVKEEIDPINRIVRLIIQEMTELDISHKQVLQKIVKHYLNQLSLKGKELSKIVKLHEQTIIDDIVPQIFDKLNEQTKIKYKVIDDQLPFEPYLKTVKVSAVPLDKDEVTEAESRGNIIDGYTRSVYSSYVFDSAQEKLLADSLENDKSVISWVRLRTGQLPIRYIYGDYNPDFVVERKDANYLVEVKDKSKLDKKDPEVIDKAKQAEEWCKIASKATGKKWVYKLLPHTAINKVNSFDAIVSSAYKIISLKIENK